MPVTERFQGVVFHGCDSPFLASDIDPDRGVYFSGDADYASDYGSLVFECVVTLECACVYNEDEANGAIEIDRPMLIAQGYDGRIVRYDNGDVDIIAFDRGQISIGPILPPILKAR